MSFLHGRKLVFWIRVRPFHMRMLIVICEYSFLSTLCQDIEHFLWCASHKSVNCILLVLRQDILDFPWAIGDVGRPPTETSVLVDSLGPLF